MRIDTGISRSPGSSARENARVREFTRSIPLFRLGNGKELCLQLDKLTLQLMVPRRVFLTHREIECSRLLLLVNLCLPVIVINNASR